MSESLARLLAVAASNRDDPGEVDRYDEMDAKRYLEALARLLTDEDFVIAIARRLFAHEVSHGSWEAAPRGVRNSYLLSALNTLDAVKDEIYEDLATNPPHSGEKE